MAFDFSSLQQTLVKQSETWLTNFGPQVMESGLKSVGLIKVSSPPKSNLTADQVSSGARGEIFPAPSGMPGWLIPVIAVVGVVVAFVAFKKK